MEQIHPFRDELFTMGPALAAFPAIPWQYVPVPECDARLLMFGDASDGMFQAFRDNYNAACAWLDEHDLDGHEARRDQRAWSLVRHWCDGATLPAPLAIPELAVKGSI